MAQDIQPLDFTIRAEVRLQATKQSMGPPTAWLIDGDGATEWLQGLEKLPEISAEARLMPIPQSIRDPTPVAVLVLPTNASEPPVPQSAVPQSAVPQIAVPQSAVSQSAVSQSAVPQIECDNHGLIGYRQIDAGESATLWIPTHSILKPHCTANQLAERLPSAHVCLWHPQAGLVAVASDQLWRIRDLLETPTLQSERSSAPPSARAFANQIDQLSTPIVVDLNEIIAQSADDIGSQQDRMSELPPLDDEPTSLSQNLSSKVRRGIAKTLLAMTSRAPAEADHETWVNRLQDWAGGQLAKTASSVMSARDRELSRLIKMLEEDPDQGLQFALPIGGTHRGTVETGSRLAQNRVDFNLNDLRGGQAASVWDMDPALQYQLTKRYRDLARREEELGRYRRAAYIHAHLLNDFRSAAAVLEKGRLWQEAAVLYRDRLEMNKEAARCLVLAERYEDGIELFRGVHRMLEAGDLCHEVGKEQLATQCYQDAVEDRLQSGETIEAAKITRDKLQDPDRAINMLRDTWPGGRETVGACRLAFHWYAEEARHEESLTFLNHIRTAPLSSRSEQLQAAIVFQSLAKAYPEAEVARQAADATRLSAAHLLANRSSFDATQVTSLIADLEPQDRVLARDAQRFLASSPPAQPSPVARRDDKHNVRLLHHWRFNGKGFDAAVADRQQVVVAKWEADRLLIERMDWGGTIGPQQSVRLKANAPPSGTMKFSPHGLRVEWVGGTEPIRVVLHQSNFLGSLTITGCRHSTEGMHPLAFTETNDHSYYVSDKGDQFFVSKINNKPPFRPVVSPVTSAQHFDGVDAGYDVSTGSPKIHVDRHALTVLCDTSLLFLNPQDLQLQETVPLPSQGTSLSFAQPRTVRRVAVGYEFGIACVWPDRNETLVSREEFPDEKPLVCFLVSGLIVSAGDCTIQVYMARERVLRRIASISHCDGQPISLTPGPQASQFAMIFADGSVKVYCVT